MSDTSHRCSVGDKSGEHAGYGPRPTLLWHESSIQYELYEIWHCGAVAEHLGAVAEVKVALQNHECYLYNAEQRSVQY